MSLSKKFLEELDHMFPALPADCREDILERADQKAAVGHDRTLPVEHRVKLAVMAHARHAHSEYDALIQAAPKLQIAKDLARRRVFPEVKRVVNTWRQAPSHMSVGGSNC